jgi:hypothetical protein
MIHCGMSFSSYKKEKKEQN